MKSAHHIQSQFAFSGQRSGAVAAWAMRMIRATDGRAAVLRALEESGFTMAEFCRRHGLVYGTVALWRAQARREGCCPSQ